MNSKYFGCAFASLIVMVLIGGCSPKFESMSPKELATYINDNLIVGQGDVAEGRWKGMYDSMMQGDFSKSGFELAQPDYLIDLLKGDCKTAVVILKDKLK